MEAVWTWPRVAPPAILPSVRGGLGHAAKAWPPSLVPLPWLLAAHERHRNTVAVQTGDRSGCHIPLATGTRGQVPQP